MIGTSFGFHDAAIATVCDDRITFAAHSERYSRNKNDKWLNRDIITDAGRYHNMGDEVAYYEKPWLKMVRQLMYRHPRPHTSVKDHIREIFGSDTKIHTVGHHESHAAAGFYTSPFSEAAIVVIDAIGEFDTVSIWEGRGRSLRKVWSQRYPHSLGLLYSAFTQRIGLKPNEHEYILMGMSAFGECAYSADIMDDFIISDGMGKFRLTKNVHRGIRGYRPDVSDEDLAASIQAVSEKLIANIFRHAAKLTGMKNVCYQGGVALNCVANTVVQKTGAFDNYWIMPNPGDSGASLGAALAKTRDYVDFRTPFLGTAIQSDATPEEVSRYLIEHGVVGLARGRAEFGPRALGNRSLLADPRVPAMQNRVNDIKKRESFRPFAPIVMADYANEYFETGDKDLRYMQYAVLCKKPHDIPAAVHVDGTSRVQTVTKDDGFIYQLLREWHKATGCPVLLNTSLNIKGEPLVNSREDAMLFEQTHGVTVF